MNGEDFYTYLKSNLSTQDIVSEKGNLFVKWLNDDDLQFTITNNSSKSIPKHIIILARDTHNKGIKITNNWLIANECNRGWCLADVLNYLIIQSEKHRNTNDTLVTNNQAEINQIIYLSENRPSNIHGQTSESLTIGLINNNLKKNIPPSKSKNILPILFVSLFFIFGIYSYLKTNYPEIITINLFPKSFRSNDFKGLYHDSYNNSIELQSDGAVHYNQLNGNSISCHTKGTWSKLDNNQLSISLEINSNCSFVSRYSGTWEIKDCFKYGQEESGCLVKGDEFYFFKK
jgi:hypothetical protein